jgi:hypothetical protein
MKTCFAITAFFTTCWASNLALAFDFARESPPQSVTDGRIGIGSRAVKLPDGQWSYLSYLKGQQSTRGGNAPIAWHTGYFAKTTASKFDMGLIFTLAEGNNQMRGWDADPCKAPGVLYKKELDSTFSFPDCILVNRRMSHLEGGVRPLLQPAKVWAENKQIEAIGAVYEIDYSRYAATGYGRIVLFIPVAKFPDEASAIEWAKNVPERFRGLFENRVKEVEFPTLP